jgi:hypothetical protein
MHSRDAHATICRALVFVAKFFDSKVPAATAKGQEAADGLGAAVAAKVQEYVAAMEKVGTTYVLRMFCVL